ncbi:uncharacterized protein LOC34619574 [Cyclospora cayetanensis]|uniref:Uncharacterized protein LOC34619574 n=1 Tax=Cyclospora cayetanensis TaxID=88456 RepID=A0A6P6RSR4_9EIME|nr:uncharacterized protein LOC34619574 [Cyclospora cayetanensis]
MKEAPFCSPGNNKEPRKPDSKHEYAAPERYAVFPTPKHPKFHQPASPNLTAFPHCLEALSAAETLQESLAAKMPQQRHSCEEKTPDTSTVPQQPLPLEATNCEAGSTANEIPAAVHSTSSRLPPDRTQEGGPKEQDANCDDTPAALERQTNETPSGEPCSGRRQGLALPCPLRSLQSTFSSALQPCSDPQGFVPLSAVEFPRIPPYSTAGTAGNPTEREVRLTSAAPTHWPGSDGKSQGSSACLTQDVSISPSKEPWYLPSNEAAPEPETFSNVRTRDGSWLGLSLFQLPADEKEQWLLQRSHAGHVGGEDTPAYSAWDLYSLNPPLDNEGSIDPDSRDRACLSSLSSSDSTTSCCLYTPASRTECGVHDEFDALHSDGDSPACCCTRSPGRSLNGLNEEPLSAKEDLFPQLAGNASSPPSEQPLAPPTFLSGRGEAEQSFCAPAGDVEACESVGPCIAPTVSSGCHRPEGVHFSAWQTMGRMQPVPPLRSSEAYLMSVGVAARRLSCSRAGGFGCGSARHAAMLHLCGASGWVPHCQEPGSAPAALTTSSRCPCKCSAFHRLAGCCQRAALAARDIGGSRGFLLGEEGRTLGCCRRLLGKSTCRCLRRCSRTYTRSGGAGGLWGAGDYRDLRSVNRPPAISRCSCNGLHHARQPSESSSCSCAAPAEGPLTHNGLPGGSLVPPTTHACCNAQCTSQDLQSQSLLCAGAAASRLRSDSCLRPSLSLGSSPLLLPGLCSRRGGVADAQGTRDGWHHRALPTLLHSSTELHDCLPARLRASQSCTPVTTSSMSPGGCMGTGSTSSSSGGASQPTFSPPPATRLLSRYNTKSHGKQELAKGLLEDPSEEETRRRTHPPPDTPLSEEPLLGLRLQDSEPQSQYPCETSQSNGGECSAEVPSSTAQLLQLDASSPVLVAETQQPEAVALACSLKPKGKPEDGGELESGSLSGREVAASGAPTLPVGDQWLADAHLVKPSCSMPSSPNVLPAADARVDNFLASAGEGSVSACGAIAERTALGEAFSAASIASSEGSGEIWKGCRSDTDSKAPQGASRGLCSEQVVQLLPAGGTSVSEGSSEPEKKQRDTCERYPGSGVFCAGSGAPQPQGKRSISSAGGDDVLPRASRLYEAGAVLLPETTRPRKTRSACVVGGWGDTEDLSPVPQKHGGSSAPPSSLEKSLRPQEGQSLGGGAANAEESPCKKQSGLAMGPPLGEGSANGSEWIPSQVEAQPAGCVSSLGTSPTAMAQGLHHAQDEALAAAGSGGSTSGMAESHAVPDSSPSPCVLTVESVKHEGAVPDAAGSLLSVTGSSDASGVGAGGGCGYKRKGGVACCLAPPAQQRLVGLQPRPPPPRVYHVVMCTRRYWRVEWVSPETGRRVYKHFGENRYGGGDRAREVAVKFWAEVRKRSADGVERGEWQGLTEVTRRVREEGVEGILEEVKAAPSPTHAQQSVAATGTALLEAEGASTDEGPLMSKSSTAAMEQTRQQQGQKQSSQMETRGSFAAGAIGATTFGVFASSPHQQNQQMKPAEGYRQRGPTLRASTRSRVLREASKDSTGTATSRLTQQHQTHGEESSELAEGRLTALELHAATGEDDADTLSTVGYSQPQQADEGIAPNCEVPAHQQPFQGGLDTHGMMTQRGESALANGAQGLGSNGVPSEAVAGGITSASADWGSQVVHQPTPLSPQLPLYGSALGATQGGGAGQYWGSAGGSQGAQEIGDDSGGGKQQGGGKDLPLKRKGSGSTCSALGTPEPVTKRYRAEGHEPALPDAASWIPSQLAYSGSGGRPLTKGAIGSLPLLPTGSCGTIGYETPCQSPLAPLVDFPLGTVDATTAASLSTGASHVLSTEASRTRWSSCSGDTPLSMSSVQSPLAFQDLRGGNGPQMTIENYPANQAASTGGGGGAVYPSALHFAHCDPQLALQQQQHQHQVLQSAPSGLEGFPLSCTGDAAYRPLQQQFSTAVQTPGVRTPTAGSSVSCSRRSRCGVTPARNKGQSSGASGRSGTGGGSGGHGTRTIGRIYSLLVRGVRCWRAEWHDRASGHRKTRQYAAPKHGEQQARALCLQALCQARSVPAQLLREAQQTFAYEPTASPEQNSEPEDAPAEPVPSASTYTQPLQQQHNQLMQPPPMDQGLHLLHTQQQFQTGEGCSSNSYAQHGYFWPSAGGPSCNAFGDPSVMMDMTDQQKYGNGGELLQHHLQSGLLEGGVSLSLEAAPPADSTAEENPQAHPSGTRNLFSKDEISNQVASASFGGGRYAGSCPGEASALCNSGFDGHHGLQDCIASKREYPEAPLAPLSSLVCGGATSGGGHQGPPLVVTPQQVCGFPRTGESAPVMTKEEPTVCGNAGPVAPSTGVDGERANSWDPTFLIAQ